MVMLFKTSSNIQHFILNADLISVMYLVSKKILHLLIERRQILQLLIFQGN